MSKRAKKIDPAPSSTRLGRMELLMEEVVEQNKLVLEHVAGFWEHFDRRLAAELAPILRRLDTIEAVLADHSRILAEHSQALRELQAEAKAARAERAADGAAVEKLDARVTALEAKVEALIAR